ncbi:MULTISPECIES: acyltransferase [unclassified Photobacterium]|uniref:acyltransferase family protein n=1 Tax=unclassified Photobacterium TaxID=2628852 RepID=UPI001EDE01EA|nr:MULTISPECIES: acyltransferase [unclassified Photobacterium]MCG3862716.1 acyltransferase [Photobacterium sp. Ph6]MCG3874247.1 acyltransferase [Photobacterium sp. Ph5]
MNNSIKAKRYDYLDNIKWVLTIIVILHHSAMTANLEPIGFNLPQVKESMQYQYTILGTFLNINASFFMSLFFFISAYFVLPSFERKGAGKFMLDKLKRLGIPTLMTLLVILPMMSLDYAVSNIKGFFLTGNIDLGVTWFCWTLIVFSGVFALCSQITAGSQKVFVDKPIPSFWKILLFTIIMIPVNFFGLYLMDTLGSTFLGFRLLKNFPMYISMFYFGVLAYRYQWLDKLELKHAFSGILMWIIAIAFIRPIASSYGFDADMVIRGFTVIGMSMFLLYCFKELFNTKGQWSSMLTRTAFAAYVVQNVPMKLTADFYQSFMTQTPLINFVVIAIPSVIGSFAIGYLICKTPVLKRIF